MRVTNASTYRNFTSSVNNVHLALNKSMNKVSSGEAYERASDAPLAYFEGKKIDGLYQDTLTKSALIKDISNRIYQQELGARTIQDIISSSGGAKNKVQFAITDTTSDASLQTTMEDLLQKQQEIVDALNVQYADYFVFGGNDYKNAPFSLEQTTTGPVLTYTHQFPGDANPTVIKMPLEKNATTGDYEFNIAAGDMANIKRAMQEQGRIDVGYGTIFDHDTLLDTFTGGLNLLTGITSDAAASGNITDADIKSALDSSAFAVVAKATQYISDYLNNKPTTADTNAAMDEKLRGVLEEMTGAEQTLSTVYSDLGNKYRLLETTESRLKTKADNLTKQYADKLGADPYEAIMELYNNNYAYNAALKVGSQLMSSSLFDFVR